MRPFDLLGIKNFRVFNDEHGFLQELSAINILTGANNSGKSSLIKYLQMLKNSIKETPYPFSLNLTNQEHLLGDFENVLFNKEKREIEISLPFTFLGLRGIYINLQFIVPSSNGTYKALLRAITVNDSSGDPPLFMFKYREADEQEIQIARIAFKQEHEHYEKEKSENTQENEATFSPYKYFFSPIENPLVGYVEWTIQFDKLKSYLVPLREFYEYYLVQRKKTTTLEEIDLFFDRSGLVPSLLINSFKGEVPLHSWTEFIENYLGEKDKISGKEAVGERDLEPEDYFFPVPREEDVLYSEALKILRVQLKWTAVEEGDMTYSVIENSFRNSWQVLLNRISAINYVSSAKEENLRVYNAASNSPFVNLLQDYNDRGNADTFVRKYLRAFEIGETIKIEYQPKYQLMSVEITTLDGDSRELVDFGYGIKQVIVFLIQINVLAEKNKRIEHGYDDDGEFMKDVYDPSVLLVEEPESNLHPKWQSLIAKMFAEASKKFNIQLIIETHSEYLIRKFQTLVASKQLDSNDVKIFYLRNTKNTSNKRQVENISIKEDGSINYKLFDSGFFDESEKLELSLLNIQRDKFWEDFEKLKNSNQENEDKIAELEQKIDDYTNKVDIAVYDRIVRQRFAVSKLSPVSVQYLRSGQFLLVNINSTGDFSPVIIQYGRAVENELKQIFNNISPTKKWMLGEMQGSLEKLKNGTSTLKHCNAAELARLPLELTNMFHYWNNLRIDLINDLREIRNSAGHAGLTKTQQEADDYIQCANDFLDKWIKEKI